MINAAIYGVGRWGQNLVKAVQGKSDKIKFVAGIARTPDKYVEFGTEMGIPIVMSDLKFMRFIAKEIFPGGAVPCDEDVIDYSKRAGFTVEETDYLTPHYVRTLNTWATALEAPSALGTTQALERVSSPAGGVRR